MLKSETGITAIYERIRERNKKLWGTNRLRIVRALGTDLRATMRDLVMELVQNAEDAEAKKLGFHLSDSGLLVWNDGHMFTERDVEAISGLLVSTKDARSIGHFGIGFKTVLLVTTRPYVLSGRFRFWLEGALDPYPIDRNSATQIPQEAHKLADAGKTVFWLPFKPEIRQEAQRVLSFLEGETTDKLLLFLDHLEEIEVEGVNGRNEAGKHQALYLASRRPYPGAAGEEWKVYKVSFLFQTDKREGESTWLRLDRFVVLPEEVKQELINRLRAEGDEEGAKRWEKVDASVLQRISVAFQIQEEERNVKMQPAERGFVFVRLPTRQETGLKFHLSGRFAATLDRAGVREDDPLTQWALEEAIHTVRQLPDQLRSLGAFPPSVWQIFPREIEGRAPFLRIASELREALRSGSYFHDAEGSPRLKEEVFLARTSMLYSLLGPAELEELTEIPGARWVHPELRKGRAKEVVSSLGVQEISARHVIAWLESKEDTWFASRSPEWLGKLYQYLASQKDLHSRAGQLPIVLLHSGKCVQPEHALFPPSKLPKNLKPFIHHLLLVADTVTEDQDTHRALRDLGVQEFQISRALHHLFRALYGDQTSPPPPQENRQHIRMLFSLWKEGEVAPADLKKWSRLPLLRTQYGDYQRPYRVYLPAGLGGLSEVEMYFRLAGGRPFVAVDYRDGEEPDDWKQFLSLLGVRNLPTISEDPFSEVGEREAREWFSEREPDRKLPRSSTGRYSGLDWTIDGFQEVLNALRQGLSIEDIRAIWVVMGHLISSEEDILTDYGARLPDYGAQLYEAILYFYYYKGQNERITAYWLRRLQDIPWLPDEEGHLARPANLFAPYLKPFLGPGLRYLHQRIPLSKKYEKLAQLLELRVAADVDTVLKYLRSLAGEDRCTISQVSPVYEWLAEQRESTKRIKSAFQSEALILIPDQGWFRTDEVCWLDRTHVVPSLMEAWGETQLKPFFLQMVGVQEEPQPHHLARYLLGLAERGTMPDLNHVQKVIEELAKRWDELSSDWQGQLKRARCWPGQRGKAIGWYTVDNLYLRDSNRLASLFEGQLAWWVGPNDNDLVSKLGIKPISAAQPILTPQDDLGPSPEVFQQLRRLWPLIARFADQEEASPPEVRRVKTIEVQYQIGSLRSASESDEAYLDCTNNRLYLVSETMDDPAHPIGDALEKGLGRQRLREFVKDLWHSVQDLRRLRKNLQRWERETEVPLTDVNLEALSAEATPQPFIPSDIEPPTTGLGEEKAQAETVDESTEDLAVFSLPGASDEVTQRYDLHTDAIQRPPDLVDVSSYREGTTVVSLSQDEQTVPLESLQPVRFHSAPDLEVADQAMEQAQRWWEDKGYEVEDVSSRKLGYDLVVSKEGVQYYVEVKGLSRPGPIVMTENEWKTAEQMREVYCLMIFVRSESKLLRFSDPTQRFKHEVRKDTRVIFVIPYPADSSPF